MRRLRLAFGRIDMNWNLVGLFFLLLPTMALGETPKPMLANVHALSEAGAMLNICFESPSYKKLNSTDALKVHGLLIRLADLVQAIAAHYKDEVLYPTYEMAKVKMSADPSLKEYAKTKYQYCGPSLITDMSSYLDENERTIREFLGKNKKQ
jgi:hypothetical protein